MVKAEDQQVTSDAPALDHEDFDAGHEEDGDEVFENPYHNPNMGALVDSDEDSEIDGSEQPNGWVTFTNDTEFGEFTYLY